MTDNIQKLYEITGVYLCNMPDVDCSKECGKCEDYNPFTAEKQLELIKWLAQKESKLEIGYSPVYGYCIENPTDTCCYYFGNQFDSALANLVNDLWQDLTDNQKQQIKGILE